jgi:hypothetical protein
MPVCPSCNLPSTDPEALFCAHCGFALPDGPAADDESFPTLAVDRPPLASDALTAQPSQPPARERT